MKFTHAVFLILALTPACARADLRADVAAHKKAEQADRGRQRADAAQAALLAEQQVQAAAALRRLENKTAGDTETLASLQAQQKMAMQKLDAAEAILAKLLPVMQRLSSQPAATMLAAPLSARDAVRGIAIMQGIASSIAAQARDVKAQAARVAALLGQANTAQVQLREAVAAQQKAEARLTAQIGAAKADEMTQADAAAREAEAAMASQRKLDTIADAVAKLVARAHEARKLPRGGGGAPVAGRIVRSFGAPTLAGPAEGVSYSAAPGARVITPCAGTVMFAGAFPAYGLMTITDCGDGTSVVLAGMQHLDVSTGQRVAHGQPVGAMLGYSAASPARQPVLYVELRQNGAPVNPAGWLAGR